MIFHLYIKGVKMKKWSEIKQATLNKLMMTEAEARQQEYLGKFQGYANECLNIIANGVKPRIKAFRVFVVGDVLSNIDSRYRIVEGSDFKYDGVLGFVIYNQNGIAAEVVPDRNVAYYDKNKKSAYIFGNDRLERLPVYNLSDTITMPDDFLSYADMINYHNNEPWSDIVYLSDRDFVVGELGDYVIYYNALWDDVTEQDVKEDTELTTHISVLNCLPTYIASQCLAQDDVQRSASLRNEFESMLSRLDTNVMYQGQHYRSTGGWY